MQHPSQNQHDSRSGTGVHTPSDTLSQQTLHPPRESLSSSSTTTNKEPGVTSDTYSVDGTTPTPPTHGTNPTIISRASSIRRTTRYDHQNMSGSVPHLPHSISIQHGMKIQPPKLRFVSSVEFRDSAGETSTTPLSPDSPTEDSSGENQKHRLQRSKGQSRKTFRYKRGRLNVGEGSALTSAPTSAPPTQPQQQAPPASASAIQQHSHFTLPPVDPDIGRPTTDVSWDSVSQTSSTSGYRDNYSFQTGLLSPDGSLNDGGMSGTSTIQRSSSQNSLLMLFEAQDEDTLI